MKSPLKNSLFTNANENKAITHDHKKNSKQLHMKNRDLKKTLYLLDRYNMSSDNFKVNHILDENIIDPIIINCYLFEKQKIV